MAILGCVLKVRACDATQVAARLQTVPGVDLALNPGDGRMVLVIEDCDGMPAAQTFAAVALLPDVHSATLVYEHAGDVDEAPADAGTAFASWRSSLADMAGQHPLAPTHP